MVLMRRTHKCNEGVVLWKLVIPNDLLTPGVQTVEQEGDGFTVALPIKFIPQLGESLNVNPDLGKGVLGMGDDDAHHLLG